MSKTYKNTTQANNSMVKQREFRSHNVYVPYIDELYSQQKSVNNNDTKSSPPPSYIKEDGQMLLISDLEGCAEFDQTKNKGPQSTVECQLPFFNTIRIFLDSNKNNKVAFLGDYFDKGPFAFQSIKYIVSLHKDYKERVIIILGNRDLLKLRIPYEIQKIDMNLNIIDEKNKNKNIKVTKLKGTTDQPYGGWKEWENFYINIYDFNLRQNKNTLKEDYIKDKLKIILRDSMGAAPALSTSNTSPNKIYNYLKYLEPLKENKNKNPNNNLFKIDQNNFVFHDDIIYLFKNSKIVHYDEYFNVLLSHAGGLNPELLKINIDKFIEKLNQLIENNSTLDYYQKIEIIRKKGLQIKNMSNNNKKLLYNNNSNNTNSNASKLKNLINSMNSLLTKFIQNTKNLTNFNLKIIPEEYFILIAMCLKSDNVDNKLLSFIDSCDNTGCRGPIVEMSNDDKNKYTEYLNKLYISGVKIIAHGHKPHCAPVPLIYKRDNSEIIFIDNDVSNGYRPSNIEEVNQVPLSYISKINNSLNVGVGFFNTLLNIKIKYDKNYLNESKLANSIKKFNFMLGEWGIEDDINIPILKEERKQNVNNSGSPKLNKNQNPIKHTLIKYTNNKELVFGHSAFNAAEASNITSNKK